MIYDFKDYRLYLKSRFRAQGSGRGQMQTVAKILGVHSTFVSLVFKGKRET